MVGQVYFFENKGYIGIWYHFNQIYDNFLCEVTHVKFKNFQLLLLCYYKQALLQWFRICKGVPYSTKIKNFLAKNIAFKIKRAVIIIDVEVKHLYIFGKLKKSLQESKLLLRSHIIKIFNLLNCIPDQ